jgi:hypothetical protein
MKESKLKRKFIKYYDEQSVYNCIENNEIDAIKNEIHCAVYALLKVIEDVMSDKTITKPGRDE